MVVVVVVGSQMADELKLCPERSVCTFNRAGWWWSLALGGLFLGAGWGRGGVRGGEGGGGGEDRGRTGTEEEQGQRDLLCGLSLFSPPFRSADSEVVRGILGWYVGFQSVQRRYVGFSSVQMRYVAFCVGFSSVHRWYVGFSSVQRRYVAPVLTALRYCPSPGVDTTVSGTKVLQIFIGKR